MHEHISRRSFVAGAALQRTFPIRRDYLAEPDAIPDFWISSLDDVARFLERRVRRGSVSAIGTSAGGRAMRAVFYGSPRQSNGTTTFSGSLGFGDVRAYVGPDHAKKVYLAMCAVHGGEFEGIVGAVNLIAVLETGRDLRGREWPEVAKIAGALDRVIVIPVTNVDGRARVPLRMIKHQGTDHTVHEYFNTGARPDGKIIGWPQCKEFIPLDFAKTQFPGGYPNDAGVNIQHDDFFGARQPETQALFDLAARERPDLILNMHTGAVFLHPLRPFLEPALTAAFEEFYRRVMTRLASAGLLGTADAATQANPARERTSAYNLDTALNLHCGAMSVTVESPSHNFSTAKKEGKPFFHTPENLLDAQLLTHLEAMKYLAETGGRNRWAVKWR